MFCSPVSTILLELSRGSLLVQLFVVGDKRREKGLDKYLQQQSLSQIIQEAQTNHFFQRKKNDKTNKETFPFMEVEFRKNKLQHI